VQLTGESGGGNGGNEQLPGIVLGDFENGFDGWQANNANIVLSNSTKGVTLGSHSLKLEDPTSGWEIALKLSLPDKITIADYLASDTIEMDVTYDPAEWVGASGWAQFILVINSEKGGWQDQGRPDTDNVNPGFTSGWDPVNFPNLQTRHVTWKISDTHTALAGGGGSYFELMFITNYGGALTKGTYYIDNVRLVGKTLKASQPDPADEATEVKIQPVLSWRPGGSAAKHNVYFGTDANDVNNANMTAHPNVTAVIADANNYTPSTLAFNKTYYWRVDEVNGTDLWKGDVWSFTTGNYLVVDDIESYGNADTPCQPSARIWYTWIDGFGWTNPAPGSHGNNTGSIVDVNAGTAHGGKQSLRCDYLNDGSFVNIYNESKKPYYSEIERTFSPAQNWTVQGMKSLTVWFYGNPGNDANATEQLYMKINGVKVIYNGNLTDLREPRWHEWNIDLSKLGVDLTNVTKLSFGFGNQTNTNPAGSGTVYFDDIRLYPVRCLPSLAKSQADFNDDCVVDFSDIVIMVERWLDNGLIITPFNPGNGSLVAYYAFENDTQDGTTGAHHGTAVGNPTYITGPTGSGQALQFNGTGSQYVNLGTWNPSTTTGQLTVSLWAKWFGLTTQYQGLIGKRDGWDPTNMMWQIEAERTNGTLGFFSNGSNPADGDPVLPVGQWAHVAATFDGTTAKFYFNGQMTGQGAFTFGSDPAAAMVIGACEANGGNPFNGAIDEVRLYNRALIAVEIAYLAGKTSPFSIEEDLNQDGTVNVKDFAELAKLWLEEKLWP
jgi:hypothetical protein